MEAIAHAKFQRYGARKVRQVLDQIRGKSIAQAEALLPAIQRSACMLVGKTLKSAAANLQNRLGKNVEPGAMFIKAAWCGLGPMGHMKRVLPAPQGRAYTFKRKVCHLTMIVTDERG
ncbi:MAG TPA: 50S ribosomal protein L22 [Elusimicrobia bacterium]|nr:50S ribosomal protein L22 [Elusimicrobiota bacterium]